MLNINHFLGPLFLTFFFVVDILVITINPNILYANALSNQVHDFEKIRNLKQAAKKHSEKAASEESLSVWKALDYDRSGARDHARRAEKERREKRATEDEVSRLLEKTRSISPPLSPRSGSVGHQKPNLKIDEGLFSSPLLKKEGSRSP